MKKTYSARLKVTIVVFVVLMIHTIIFYAIFSNIDVVKMLESSTYRYYEHRLSESAKKLERKMANDFSSEKSLEPLIREVDYEYENSGISGAPVTLSVHIAGALLESLNNANAAGAFVLMSENFVESPIEKDEIFFLRDNNKNYKATDNSDIVVEIGSAELANTIEINFDGSWKPNIDPNNGDNKTFEEIKNRVVSSYKNSDIKNQKKLGFWLSGVDLSDDRSDNIVYVEPIMNRWTRELYGIVGVEISEDMIADVLEMDTFSSEFEVGFTLLNDTKQYTETPSDDNSADKTSDLKQSYVISYFGDYIDGVDSKKNIVYRSANKEYTSLDNQNDEQLYLLETTKESQEQYYGLVKTINIYDKDSYYSNDDWQLGLFMNSKNFSYHEDRYTRNLNVTLLVSLILALVLSFVLSIILTKPIRKLAKNIEDTNVNKDLKLTKTNIKEMDLLIDKIEEMSENIGEFYFKMQNLLEFIGFGIVIIEEDEEKGMMYRTGKLSMLFGKLDETEGAISEYTREEFQTTLEKYTGAEGVEFIDSDANDNFSIIKTVNEKTGEVIYISYEQKLVNGKRFHVYLDYTNSYNDILALEHEKNYDFLTSLINRSYFKKLVEEKIESSPDKQFAMIMWDLDNLKYINDNYGHDWGDLYIQETAKIISALRVDEEAYVSRFSGDEFFAFLEYNQGKDAIRESIHILHDKLLNTELKITNLESVKIRASVGICWYPEDGQNYEELHKFADFAMYQAKHTNKGSIIEFERNIYDSEYIVLSGKEEFNRLIEERLVRFAFQPIVSAKTGEIFAYEALMRTMSDVIKSVDDVMKIAKVQFKLPLVEKLTFEGVFDEIEDRKAEFEGKKIFINSIANVVIENAFEENIRKKLEIWGEKIVIEITEGEELDNKSMDIKKRYRENYGNLIAIDDLGSGYSTEKTLLRINPDYIKIDMGIVRDIHKDRNRRKLVENIIEFAKSVGIKTIAEGVEVKEEMNVLIEIGIDFIQGYYLAKPNFEILDGIEIEKKEQILEANKMKKL